MKNFQYIFPEKTESLPKLLAELRGTSILYAGGTDANARLKEGIDKPDQVINLKSLRELNYIREESGTIKIGALTQLTEMLSHRSVEKHAGLAEAIKSVGTIQLRNMGTIGGNLCQRPRCWYFRSRHFPCLRKHGDICYAVEGQNKYHAILGGAPCYIVHPSDPAVMLIALDASVNILGPEGNRNMKLQDFYVLPEEDPYNETVLSEQDILTEVIVPVNGKKSHYLKFRERKSIDFALVSVSVAANVSAKKVSNIHIALGGVAPVPWRATAAEKILEGQEIDPNLMEKAAEAELKNAEPLAQNKFKMTLVKKLLPQAISELMEA